MYDLQYCKDCKVLNQHHIEVQHLQCRLIYTWFLTLWCICVQWLFIYHGKKSIIHIFFLWEYNDLMIDPDRLAMPYVINAWNQSYVHMNMQCTAILIKTNLFTSTDLLLKWREKENNICLLFVSKDLSFK